MFFIESQALTPQAKAVATIRHPSHNGVASTGADTVTDAVRVVQTLLEKVDELLEGRQSALTDVDCHLTGLVPNTHAHDLTVIHGDAVRTVLANVEGGDTPAKTVGLDQFETGAAVGKSTPNNLVLTLVRRILGVTGLDAFGKVESRSLIHC